MVAERHDPRRTGARGLRLRAEDADDLAVISACLQDAVTSRAQMRWQQKERRFAMLVNRYRWERQGGERIRAGLHFDGVEKVVTRDLDGVGPDQVLSLLAIASSGREEGRARITLVFAGGPLVRLEAECIDASLNDIGEGWMTPRHPDHGEDPTSGRDGEGG
ncbi:MAG: DUF2948 family protein [Alphaproteobacteria bacterium]|nr:DUF2948 family protein [Alphaproteobacteria bacterium]